MPKHTLIVGAGIAGLLAAILRKKKDPSGNVTLIEQAESCGGLLRSVKYQDWEFDYGSHILSQTLVPELDEILFDGLDLEHWHQLSPLKSGVYFSGLLHQTSQFTNLKNLPDETLHRITYELLESVSRPKVDSSTLEEQLVHDYGPTITEVLYRPLMQRQLGVDLSELAPNAHCYFGYQRIILGNAEMMRLLKQQDRLDEILAFDSYNEGLSQAKNYYPKNGRGVALWVDALLAQAESLGVKVQTNTALETLDTEGQNIQRAHLSDGSSIDCSELIWSIAPYPLLQISKTPYQPSYRPKIRKMALFHAVFDRAFLCHDHHVYCNDPALSTFRVTLYSNITEEAQPNGDHRCTIEVLLNDDVDDYDALQAQVLEELKTMQLVSADARCVATFQQPLAAGFPVVTNQFVSAMAEQRQLLEGRFNNLTLLGRSSANAFFMKDVLKEVYEKLQ